MTPEVRSFVAEALECSIYAAPNDYGLTRAELHIVAEQMGFRPGEVDVAVRALNPTMTMGQPKIMPDSSSATTDFFSRNEPEYRSPGAFDFLTTTLRDLGREVGPAKAWMDRGVLVQRGVAAGHDQHDIDVAFAFYLLSDWFEIDEHEAVRLSGFKHAYALAQAQLAQSRYDNPRPTLNKTLTFVRDVIARRTDGRPKNPEPLKAFEDAIESLGYRRFRMWWIQTVAELSRTESSTSPMSVCVLSAALSEGALVFVVRHARSLNIGPMMSGTFNRPETQWKFDDLLASAASGGKEAIFDQTVRDRTDRLNTIRQRIHVGRLISDYPDIDVPDVKPDQAREARETLEQVVRSILEWLRKHPAPNASGGAPPSRQCHSV